MKDRNVQVVQDVRDPDFYQNPYPYYEKWRRDSPIFFWEDYGHWTFASHAHVDFIMSDRRFGRAIDGCPLTANTANDPILEPFFEADRYSLLNLEPPRHTRLRRLVNRAFTSGAAMQMRSQIQSIATGLCTRLGGKLLKGHTVDLLAEYASPLPVAVIAHMLAIPVKMHDQLLQWSHAMIRMYEPTRSRQVELESAHASREFMAFLEDLIEVRRESLGTDLLSDLLRATTKDDQLTNSEIKSTIILLLNAGHEATVHLIANACVALMVDSQGRKDWLSIMNDSLQAQTGVAELLRYDSPLHMFNRFVLEDIEIDALQLRRGDTVSLLLASANHDELRFDHPSSIYLDRSPNSHISFGRGIHFCLGAPLARLEIEIALSTLFTHFPNLQLDQMPERTNTYHFHKYDKVAVKGQ